MVAVELSVACAFLFSKGEISQTLLFDYPFTIRIIIHCTVMKNLNIWPRKTMNQKINPVKTTKTIATLPLSLSIAIPTPCVPTGIRPS